jgi:aminopeptidase N
VNRLRSFLPMTALFPPVVFWGVVLAYSQQKQPGGTDIVAAETAQCVHGQVAAMTASQASDWFDATYYRLDLHMFPTSPNISGTVRIQGIARQDHPSFLSLDLTNSMRIDSVIVDGRRSTFVQHSSSFNILIDSVYHPGDLINADVYYEGSPAPTGFGSFVVSSHSGTSWVWSLSEPYGAKDWWPCKDAPSDKADSVDVIVTCDSSFWVGSNGTLISRTLNADGTAITHWQERYAIATYLVSIAATNYARFSNWFRYTPSDSLEVLNYVLPESLSSAQQRLPSAVDGLRIFSNMFGLYPFIKEKYGHSQFSAGGMEHQTMTSITSFDEEIIIHELAHQWFGDMITCASWAHLWLNEGFATYCTALYLEKSYGISRYSDFMGSQLTKARLAVGSVYARDTSNVHTLFNGPRVYAKGACVLHMLRHLLGDSLFFQSMHAYANEPTVRFKSAVTDDFQQVCERTSGRDLSFFFNEWIYGENYPLYSYSWNMADSSGKNILRLRIRQSTGTTAPPLFKMPLDIRLFSSVWDSTITIFDSSAEQVFSFIVPGAIDSVMLDPGGWILKTAFDESANLKPTGFSLSANYPNPFNNMTSIRYSVPHRMNITLRVYDLLGRKVSTLVDATQNVGSYVARWDGGNLATGIYFYELEAVEPRNSVVVFRLTKKMILLK